MLDSPFWAPPPPKYSQSELEAAYIRGGVLRAEAALARAMEAGRAGDSAPAMGIIGEYMLILARAIREYAAEDGPTGHTATAALLRCLPPEPMAYLAIRRVLSQLMAQSRLTNEAFRSVAYSVGAAVHEELCTQQVQNCAPGLFYAITRDLGRQGRGGDRSRVRYSRKAARAKSLPVKEWRIEHRHILGVWLVDKLVGMGMLLKLRQPKWDRTFKHVDVVYLSKRCMDRLDEFQAGLEFAGPAFGPCVNPPLDYAPGRIGGWYTRDMQRRHPELVRGHPSSREAQDSPVVLGAVNALQGTAWAVNKPLLAALQALRKSAPGLALWGRDPGPRPEPVSGPDAGRTNAEMYAAWYEDHRRYVKQRARVSHALAMAHAYSGYDQFYFCWFMDTRGRMYPFASGLNPQGADLEKGLLVLPEAGGCHDATWIMYQGANLWGFDKAPLAERSAWAASRMEEWRAVAAAPTENLLWLEAAEPVQFLAWCMEVSAWAPGRPFRTPVAFDATCSGLQHLAALTRSEALGGAVNLTKGETRADVYGTVLGASKGLLEADPEAWRWRGFALPRAWVKPAAMNYSYGITRGRFVRVTEEAMDREARNVFPPHVQTAEASRLARHVWAAMTPVLAEGAALRTSLEQYARGIAQAGAAAVRWTTPSGFKAAQSYYTGGTKRVRTAVLGHRDIRVPYETPVPDVRAASRSFPANYIQSMDASHAHLTAARMAGVTTCLSFVHDSFGCDAAHAGALYKVLRETFADMYRCSPLEQLGIPAPGSWCSDAVIESEFFFS